MCSSLVETDTKTLYSCVKHLETHLNRQLTFVKNLEKEYSEETGKIDLMINNYVSLVLLCLNFVNTLSSFLMYVSISSFVIPIAAAAVK